MVYDIDEVKKGYDITKANTFLNILSYTNLEDIKNKFISSFNDKEYDGEQSSENKTFVLKTRQDIEYSEIEIKRASKTIKDDSNEKALKYGEKLHYLLELVDFSTKNVDFIKDEKDKKIIKNVINNPLFDIGGDDKILHEYSYHDDHNGVDGVIDCLLIKDNEIDIIDFKLKNIDDELYKNQLLTYKKYISQIISGKIIKMYLLSIIDNSVKKGKDD